MKPQGPRPFPWEEAMAFGLGILRLNQRDFWQMTPRELRAAIRAMRGVPLARLSRSELENLMQTFPDHARPPQ